MVGKIILYIVVFYFVTFLITMLSTFIINKIKEFKVRKALQQMGVIKRDIVNAENDKVDDVNRVWNEALKIWEIQN